jgi:hypothetical protein
MSLSSLVLTNKEQQELAILDTSLKTSRDGYSFDINSNKWILNKDVTIGFQHDVLGGRVKFLPLAWAGMPKTSFRKNSDSPRFFSYFSSFSIKLSLLH